MNARIETVVSLSDEQVSAVQELVRSSPDAADNPPLSEGGLFQLRAAAPVQHLIALSDKGVLGYAQLSPAAGSVSAELVAVDVEVAGQLIADLPPDARLWAHGAASVAHQVAHRAGLRSVRTLLQLRRSLPELVLPEPTVPEDVRIRAFVPGQDDEQWLAVNAHAFASHPEQGAWTRRELSERLSAAWFDPAGFLLAERISDGQLLGYHWTKVHIDLQLPVGEVYVLGIDPAAQGMRLGTLLLNEGLRFLQAQGLASVLLYVEKSSTTAVHLYEKAGFSVFAMDIQYALI